MLRAFLPLAGLAAFVSLADARPVPSSALPALAAPCLAAGGEAASESEEVVLETSDGLKLAATFRSPGRGGRAPGVVLVHDPATGRAALEEMGSHLRKRGFAVLSLDLRAHAKSAGADKPFDQLSREEQERAWAFSLRDLEAAGAFLRARRDVHTTNLSLLAVGRSAGLALRYASQDENVRALVLVGAGEDQLGFALQEEVRRCGGLPTLLLAAKDARAYATRLMEAVEDDGTIELSVLKSEAGQELGDKRLPNEVARFLNDVVTPKRGS